MPNGVDVRCSPRPRGTAPARRELELPGGPLVVCLGRICRAKGQDQLVESWSRVLERVPDATLALVGGGPDVEQVRSLPAEHVLFTGERTDAPAWLAAADVVAAPSRWEGMSFAMLETMASARSLVITDVPGARDALAATPGSSPRRPASACRRDRRAAARSGARR
jgi:glycosyltransferase involved in cell wall biosynthesis